jgi:hypothetical protein
MCFRGNVSHQNSSSLSSTVACPEAARAARCARHCSSLFMYTRRLILMRQALGRDPWKRRHQYLKEIP